MYCQKVYTGIIKQDTLAFLSTMTFFFISISVKLLCI